MGSQREQMNGTTNLKQSTIANRVCDNLEILRISSESPQTKVLLNKAHNGNLNGGTESKDQNRNRQEKQIAGRPQTKPKVTTDGTAMGSVTAGSNGVPQDLAVHILAPGSFDDDACDVADMNGISANKTVDNANAEAPNLASSSVLELPQSPKGGKETRAPKRSRLSHREEASNLSSSSILPQSPKVEKETRAPKRSRLSHREEASNIPSSSILPQSPKVEKEMQAPEGQLLACREDALTIAGNDVDPATARTINPQSPQPTPNVVSEAPTGSRFADAHQVTGEPTVEIPEVKKESRMFWRGSNHVLNRCIMRVKDKIPSRKIRESSANVALVGFGSRTSTANDKIPSGRIREGSTDVAFVELDGLKLVKDAYPSAKDCINFEQSISERLECLISTITFDGPEAESSTIEELQMILDKSGKVTPCIVISCASQHRALDIKKCLKERLELFDLYDLPWEVICDPKRVGFLALLAASTGEHFPIGKHGYSARTPSNNGNFWDKYAAAPLYLVPEPTEGKLRDQNSDCLASCTLGGFIEVANSIYGLTVAHPLFNAIAMNPTRMPEDGKAMTLNVGNIIACVLSNVSSNNTTATEMQDPVPPNSDWALIELGEDFDRAKWDHSWTAAYSSPIPQEKLEIQEDADLEPREVLIRAGFSGNVKGKLRIARSRLQIGSSRFSAMSIELEEHSSLTRGDSGSFVILDGSICGTIIAGRDSLNLAYMLPIADTFHSIATEYGGVSVRFPSVGTRQQVQPTSSRPVESTPFGQDAPAKGKRPPFKDISTINELEIGKLEIPDPPTKSPSGPEAPLNKTGIWQKGRKCQACRNSEKLCLRDGGDWNEQDPQTRCSRCKNLNLTCGPEYKIENDKGKHEVILSVEQRVDTVDNREVQPLGPHPYTEAYLRRRLRELSDSVSLCTIRQNIKSLEHGWAQGFTVPEDLLCTLADIEELAGRAYASNDLSIAELAFIILEEWYNTLGPEFQHLREKLLIKMGSIFEKTEWKDRAEEYSLKIFDYLLVEPPDINAPFHHAIRNFKKKGLVGQDALMRIIRCCPLYRFKLRNKEGQTPLWLAVSTNEEEVIIAMIKRLRDPQQQFWIDPTIFDATDPRGLSILTTAIMAGCSLRLIDALIQCGSKVNPPPRPDAPSTPLPDAPSTPLRAASIPGCERPEVVWLLLRHQANPGDICPGSSIAVLVAKGLLPEPAYVPLLPKLDQ